MEGFFSVSETEQHVCFLGIVLLCFVLFCSVWKALGELGVFICMFLGLATPMLLCNRSCLQALVTISILAQINQSSLFIYGLNHCMLWCLSLF